MKFVQRPQPIEAVLVDCLQTAMDFLKPGELIMLEQDKITIHTVSGQALVRFGHHYILRDAFGTTVIPKAEFEQCYEPFTEATPTRMADYSFSAHRDGDDNHWTLECSGCGPIGMVSAELDVADVATDHYFNEHGGSQ